MSISFFEKTMKNSLAGDIIDRHQGQELKDTRQHFADEKEEFRKSTWFKREGFFKESLSSRQSSFSIEIITPDTLKNITKICSSISSNSKQNWSTLTFFLTMTTITEKQRKDRVQPRKVGTISPIVIEKL